MGSVRVASIFGLVFFGAITFIVTLKAGSIFIKIPFGAMRDAERTIQSTHITPSQFKLMVERPVRAFTKSSLTMVTRDMGRLTLLILPLLLPLMVGAMSSATMGDFPIVGISYVIGYLGIMPAMINMAFSSSEERVGGTIASLPYRVWEQFKARRRLMVGFMLIPFLIMLIFVSADGSLDTPQMLYFLSVAPFIIVLATVHLILFSLMFGKVNRTYTLYEVNIQWRGAKIMALVGVPTIMVVTIYIGFIIYILFTDAAEIPATIILWILVLVLVGASDLVARRVFRGPSVSETLESLSQLDLVPQSGSSGE
jgi:hypothetical protein